MSSPGLTALLGVILLLSFGVEATLGFGCNVLAVTLAAHFYPLDRLLPLLVTLNPIVSLYIVLRYREAIAWRVLATRIFPFMLLGMPAGMLLFTRIDGPGLKLGFGVFVLALSSVQLVRLLRRSEAAARPLPSGVGPLFLLAGGLMHGLYASGGPMAVIFTSRVLPEKMIFRSTMSFLWLALNLTLLVGYLARGVAGAQTVLLAGIMLPALVAGVFLGDRIHGRVEKRTFGLLVNGVLLAGALVLVIGLWR